MGLNTPKGYHKADFTDVWNRYASPLSGILTATTDTLATNHVQNKTATIAKNSENVSEAKHEQLSYDVSDVADTERDRTNATVDDDVDLGDPPEATPLDAADYMPLDDELEQWEIDAGVILGANGERIIVGK